MTRPWGRPLAALVVVTGIAIGTAIDRTPTRSMQRAGEYFVLAGDFHVHAFPGDGALAPWTLRDEAGHAGLDVLAVTNHNRTFTAHLARWLAGMSNGPIVIAGQEITNPRYHLIAIGIERTVNASQPAAGAIADVHAQGGVAIAAHPTLMFRGYDDDATVAALDGTEAAHPADVPEEQEMFAAFFERARRLKPSIAPIGSSDFHASPSLARCRTLVFAREPSASGVIDAIRSGRTVAVDQNGRQYGDPALIGLIAHTSPAGRSDEQAGWRQLSVALAWLGLLGMLLFA
ncbi:MAG TPA: CehA/McbA family metallohydrolase [Vicinamibacterales bacterium]|nr:CehA/McbA family metallohydrolase [Vicinamibacterales bacterium]